MVGNLVDISGIFYFFLLGGGKGESEAPGEGGVLENPRRGEGFPVEKVGGKSAATRVARHV